MVRIVFHFCLTQAGQPHVLLTVYKFCFRKFMHQEIAVDCLIQPADIRICLFNTCGQLFWYILVRMDDHDCFIPFSLAEKTHIGNIDLFGSERIDWDALLGGLPATPPVSENQGSVVLEYQGKYHIKLGQGDWVPYPL